MKIEDILIELRERGFRNTENRKAMLKLFSDTKKPLEAERIQARMKHLYKKTVHKVTVYRELDFLHKEGIINEVVFGDRKKRYELASRPHHHHHLVCKRCRKVEDIQMKDDLLKAEQRIMRKKGFSVSYHSLEFFGLCNSCQ